MREEPQLCPSSSDDSASPALCLSWPTSHGAATLAATRDVTHLEAQQDLCCEEADLIFVELAVHVQQVVLEVAARLEVKHEEELQ